MGMPLPTYFAPPEKEEEVVLVRQLESLVADPVVDQLLDSLPEPTLILNTAGSLKGMAEILGELRGEEERAVKETVRSLSGQIVEEIQSQRDLVAAESGDLAVTILDRSLCHLRTRDNPCSRSTTTR